MTYRICTFTFLLFGFLNLDTNTSAGTGTRVWGEAVPAIWNLITGTNAVGSFRQTTWSSAKTGIQSITMLSTQYVGVLAAEYGSWADQMGLTGALAAPDADPRGVGISNLLRYVLGMDLSSIHYDRLPQFRVFEGESGMPPSMGFSFYAVMADDVSFIVEVSADLKSWSLLPEGSVHWEKSPLHEGLREIQMHDLEARLSAPARRFYRLLLQKEATN